MVVEVSGEIKPGGLERLNRIDHGFTYRGALLPPAKVSWQSETRLRFALKGEVPGQIAYMCEASGLTIDGDEAAARRPHVAQPAAARAVALFDALRALLSGSSAISTPGNAQIRLPVIRK